MVLGFRNKTALVLTLNGFRIQIQKGVSCNLQSSLAHVANKETTVNEADCQKLMRFACKKLDPYSKVAMIVLTGLNTLSVDTNILNIFLKVLNGSLHSTRLQTMKSYNVANNYNKYRSEVSTTWEELTLSVTEFTQRETTQYIQTVET